MAVCQAAGYTSWRDRVLTPVTTIQRFRLQMLHGHAACSHVPPLLGVQCSASASWQARTRLPLHLFGLLLTRLCTSAPSLLSDEGRWHGPRTFVIDGPTGGKLRRDLIEPEKRKKDQLWQWSAQYPCVFAHC
jgi:hypothetical protein